MAMTDTSSNVWGVYIVPSNVAHFQSCVMQYIYLLFCTNNVPWRNFVVICQVAYTQNNFDECSHAMVIVTIDDDLLH